MLPNRDRGNKIFARQTDEDDDDDEEEKGGFIQPLQKLLPLAAPILKKLSDPNSDVDIAKILQSVLPLIEGLSDPNKEGGIDIPGVLMILSQRLSNQEPYEQSVLSDLITSITAMLSKKLSKSAGDSDIQSLVSAVALGVFAGTSGKNHGTYGTYGTYGTNSHRDTYSANTAYDIQPTSYGQPTSYRQYYHPYGPTKPPTPDFGETLSSAKEVLGSFLKFSTGSSFSSTNLSDTSSSSEPFQTGVQRVWRTRAAAPQGRPAAVDVSLKKKAAAERSAPGRNKPWKQPWSSSSTDLSASLSYSAEKEEKPTYSALTRPSYYALPPQSTRPADSLPGQNWEVTPYSLLMVTLFAIATGQSWEVTRYLLLIVTLFSIAIVTFFQGWEVVTLSLLFVTFFLTMFLIFFCL